MFLFEFFLAYLLVFVLAFFCQVVSVRESDGWAK